MCLMRVGGKPLNLDHAIVIIQLALLVFSALLSTMCQYILGAI